MESRGFLVDSYGREAGTHLETAPCLPCNLVRTSDQFTPMEWSRSGVSPPSQGRGEGAMPFLPLPRPPAQLDAEDVTVLRDGSTAELKSSGFLNHHLEESLPLRGKLTMNCHMNKKGSLS